VFVSSSSLLRMCFGKGLERVVIGGNPSSFCGSHCYCLFVALRRYRQNAFATSSVFFLHLMRNETKKLVKVDGRFLVMP